MIGPSTGTLRCFKRCEDDATGVDLVFIMLSEVPIFVEACWRFRLPKKQSAGLGRMIMRSTAVLRRS